MQLCLLVTMFETMHTEWNSSCVEYVKRVKKMSCRRLGSDGDDGMTNCDSSYLFSFYFLLSHLLYLRRL